MEKTFLLANIYAPNEDNPKFFLEIFDHTTRAAESEIAIMGDFNLVMDPELDRISKKEYAPKSRKIVLEMCQECDLVDIWRCLNPDKRTYSWIRKNYVHNRISGSRIDFALISQGLANNVVECKYQYGHKMDHSMYSITLNVVDTQRGPGYWKFNKLILHDKIYVDKCNQIIEQAQEKHAGVADDDIWLCCKDDLIQWSKKRAMKIARDKKQYFRNITAKLDALKLQLTEDSVGIVEDIKKYQQLIERHLEEHTRAAAFRSRAQYANEHEKSSKFFFALEKRRYNAKTMTKLIDDQGNSITNPKKILKAQHEFYSELYSSDKNTEFKFQNKDGKTISEADKIELEKDYTFEEITQAVKELKSNKSAGSDGLCAEFFQFFWSRLGRLYYNAIIRAKANG